MNESEFIVTYRDQIAKPGSGIVLFTLNIPSNELEYLTSERHGQRFFSKDEPAIYDPSQAQVDSNLKRVFDSAQLDVPKEFVSLSVRTSFNNAENCKIYGRTVLVLDKEKIGAECVIFNGDLKDLGRRIADHTIETNERWIEVIRANQDDAAILSWLQRMQDNARIRGRVVLPRLTGSYFEARILRALRPTDIVQVHVSERDRSALNASKMLLELRNTMSA